jgi:hypothetical protein
MLFGGAAVSNAEMRTVTVAAIVKSFDHSTVTVQIHRRQMQIPRDQVEQKELRVGTAIFLTFRGEQIERLIRTMALNPSNRRPASLNAPLCHETWQVQ